VLQYTATHLSCLFTFSSFVNDLKEKSNSNLIKFPDDIKLGAAANNSKGKKGREEGRKGGRRTICWKQ